MTDLQLALGLAERFHAGQKYGDEPYMYHINAVVNAALEFYPSDERVHIVCALHDLLEDTLFNEAMLRSLFDKDVADAVVAITHWKGVDRIDYVHVVKTNPLAAKAKRCDAHCNLTESLKRGDDKRVAKYGYLLYNLALP